MYFSRFNSSLIEPLVINNYYFKFSSPLQLISIMKKMIVHMYASEDNPIRKNNISITPSQMFDMLCGNTPYTII